MQLGCAAIALNEVAASPIQGVAVRSITHGRFAIVPRAIERLIAVALALAAWPGSARADFVDDQTQELATATHYKRRLAAALTLAKVHEGRAVRSLASAMERDDDPKLRQVAALALASAVTGDTPAPDRVLAFAALERVQRADGDAQVRELAARTLVKLDGLRVVLPSGPPPAIFIYVAAATDASTKAPGDATDRLAALVRAAVTRRAPELPTQWPGPLPTEKALTAAGTRAYAVSTTIATIDIVQRGSQVEIACRVQVRITPWTGVDGAERWVAHKAASASGGGRVTGPSTPRSIAGGIRDCVNAVAEEVTAKQVVPFLRKVVASS